MLIANRSPIPNPPQKIRHVPSLMSDYNLLLNLDVPSIDTLRKTGRLIVIFVLTFTALGQR